MESVYFNQEAEEQVLSLAMKEADCLRQVTELNRAELYFPEHQAIHDAICALAAARTGVDLITVSDWLNRNQKMDAAGGLPMVTGIYGKGFLPSMIKSYLKIVHECYSRRQQRQAAKEYIDKLDAGEDTEETREWMVRQMKDVKEIRDTGLISMQDAAIKTFDQLDKDQKREDQPTNRILSGISTMDNKLGGLRGSEYVAIGARPSVGKSIFALTYCVNAAKQ